jgi:hypothetical protein
MLKPKISLLNGYESRSTDIKIMVAIVPEPNRDIDPEIIGKT